MNDEQESILLKEIETGNKAKFAYDSYMRDRFESQKQALYDNFMREKTLAVRETIHITLNSILAVEKTILSDIETGRMASKQLQDAKQ